jgi:cytochrome c peroxidase
MRPTTLMRLFTACLIVLGALFIFRGVLVQSSTPQIYDPYPPGILPPDLNTEIARVLREIDVIEARAIERWHSLPPPTRLETRPGPNPPVLKDTGTESIETLGELMLFDKNMSPGRNQACASCHMPYAGWSGPIPSVNLTIIAYPGTVHFRAGKRTAQRHTYAPFFPVLQYNQEQGLFFGGNFWDSRATGYRLRNPDAEQAQGPPVDTQEMGFPDTACVAFRLKQSVYRPLFELLWGKDSLDIKFPPTPRRSAQPQEELRYSAETPNRSS